MGALDLLSITVTDLDASVAGTFLRMRAIPAASVLPAAGPDMRF